MFIIAIIIIIIIIIIITIIIISIISSFIFKVTMPAARTGRFWPRPCLGAVLSRPRQSDIVWGVLGAPTRYFLDLGILAMYQKTCGATALIQKATLGKYAPHLQHLP